jgi:hypothetical protein
MLLSNRVLVNFTSDPSCLSAYRFYVHVSPLLRSSVELMSVSDSCCKRGDPFHLKTRKLNCKLDREQRNIIEWWISNWTRDTKFNRNCSTSRLQLFVRDTYSLKTFCRSITRIDRISLSAEIKRGIYYKGNKQWAWRRAMC